MMMVMMISRSDDADLTALVARAAVLRTAERLVGAGGRPLGAIRPALTQVLAEELEEVLRLSLEELQALYNNPEEDAAAAPARAS